MQTFKFKDAKGKTRRIGFTLEDPKARLPKKPKRWVLEPSMTRGTENASSFLFFPSWNLNVDGVDYPLTGPAVMNVSRFPRLARLWFKVRRFFGAGLD